MKTKDIITLIISSVVIVGSIYFILGMNKPKEVTVEESEVDTARAEYTGNLDSFKETIEDIQESTDYGEPNLDNIGRENPFAPLQ